MLGLTSDERLVDQIRAGNEAAFEVAFERYGKGIMSFCRYMLGSQEEAEDAVQHTFASAYRDLGREGARELRLKPWLYTIARNRCLSMLRARRDELHVETELPTVGLAEQVERRAELRELLADISELPAEQRAALLLAEAADLSHADIADVLDCEVARVKALVYRARSALIDRREARETPCEEIRQQLAVLSGGALRRSGIRHHLKACSGCRAYREQVKRQRQMLAVVLPVAPPAWLKAKLLAATGGGGAAAGGLGGGVAGGASTAVGAGAAGSLGSAVVAKVAVLAVLAGGGAAVTEAVLEEHKKDAGTAPLGSAAADDASPSAAEESPDVDPRKADRPGALVSGPARARHKGRHRGRRAHDVPANENARGPAEVPGSRGAERRTLQEDGVPRGRGAPEAPPTTAPVERGPVTKEAPVTPTPSPEAGDTQPPTPRTERIPDGVGPGVD